MKIKNFIVVLAVHVFLIVPLTASAAIIPISDIATQTVSYFVSDADGGFAWNTTYDIGLTNQRLDVTLNIRLIGADPGASLKQIWKNGIESIWSNKYRISDGTLFYPITFHTNWVTSLAHHTVTVTAGNGGVNMLNWYTGNPSGWGYSYQDRIAAHESGHMFGLYDEYSGGATKNGFVEYGGLMNTLNGVVRQRYYNGMLSWLSTQSGQNLSLAVVPEPKTVTLFILGLLGICCYKRKICSKNLS